MFLFYPKSNRWSMTQVKKKTAFNHTCISGIVSKLAKFDTYLAV